MNIEEHRYTFMVLKLTTLHLHYTSLFSILNFEVDYDLRFAICDHDQDSRHNDNE